LEQIRPQLGDDVDQMIQPLGIDRSQHGRVDRGNRAGMAACEGDEILIGLLDLGHPLAQRGDAAAFKVDHLAHKCMLYMTLVKRTCANMAVDLRLASRSSLAYLPDDD